MRPLKNSLTLRVEDHEKGCTGRDLAAALGETSLPEKEAAAWHRDLRTARRILKASADKWR